MSTLRPQLLDLLGGEPGQGIFSAGRVLAADALLGDAGLRSGDVLMLGCGSERRHPSTAMLQLRVVGGPDCGHVVALSRGKRILGRDDAADVTVKDPDISRVHAELVVDAEGIWLRDLGSTNGTWLEQQKVGSQPVQLRPGTRFTLGSSTLAASSVDVPPAATMPDGVGGVRVNTPPRIAGPAPADPVEFPPEPSCEARPRTQWLAALLPTGLGVGLAVAMHSSQFLAFALLTPITLLAGAASQRWDWRRSTRRLRAEHAKAETAAEAVLAARLEAEGRRRRQLHPDAAAVLNTVTGPDCRLWERQLDDPAFLCIRLGVTDRPAETCASRAGALLRGLQVPSVPATIALRHGPLGIAGPLPLARGAARWVLGQLLAMHSPVEVRLVVLLDGDGEDWRWLRWLAGTAPSIAADDAQHRELVADLVRTVTERKAAAGASGWGGAWTVLLIDRISALASIAGLRFVLEHGPAVGITAVCLDSEARLLPASCRATALTTADTGSRLSIAAGGQEIMAAVIAERVPVSWCDQLARSLAPLHPAAADDSAALPTEVDLLELLGVADPGALTPEAMVSRWKGSSSAVAPIGMSTDGVIEFDLVRDGPHALIAGTTGSGKSELLRSVVLGLGVRSPPQELSFLLIDYKGGAAFAECAELPHTLGVVTDLDPHLTRRVLMSLNAELRSREATLAEAGVVDLSAYRRSARAAEQPMSRLVLVVDEFAALAEEFPSFLTGLVGVAQRGRSLGVHLVLATQRPSGVVSAEIRANMALRIALRVTDSSESSDVLADDSASRIPAHRPGRAIGRLTRGLVEFQTARVLGMAAGARSITITELDEWNRAPASPPHGEEGTLRRVCEAIGAASELLGHPLPGAPWLPPLPSLVSTAALPDPVNDRYAVSFGRTDDPGRQTQVTASHNLSTGGSIAFIGGPRSGRSTALRTFVGQASSRLSADELHVYSIDCAGHGLAGLSDLPQTGAAVSRSDPALISRLLSRLLEELDRRQRTLADLGADSFADAMTAGTALPAVLLVIDGWDAFSALSEVHDGGRSTDAVLRLLRDSAAAGFTVILAGDRAVLGVRIASALGRKLLLRLTDPNDYAMAGVALSALPAEPRPGQAVDVADGLETQVALLGADPSPAGQRAALRAIAAIHGDARHRPAIRLRTLPTIVRFAELAASRQCGPGDCLLGVGGDDAHPVEADLFNPGSRFLIAGPPRSGRSTAALIIAAQARSAGLRTVVAATGRSPLCAWARQHGVTVLGPAHQLASVHSSTSVLDTDHFDAEVIVVEDAEHFTDTPVGELVTDLIARSQACVVATARSDDLLVSYRGIATDLRRHRRGLLLQPTPVDGELLGVRIPPQPAGLVPGRGVLVTDQTRELAESGLPLQVAVL